MTQQAIFILSLLLATLIGQLSCEKISEEYSSLGEERLNTREIEVDVRPSPEVYLKSLSTTTRHDNDQDEFFRTIPSIEVAPAEPPATAKKRLQTRLKFSSA